MNTSQSRIFELLQKELPNESLSTVEEYRLGTGGLPVHSIYLDDQRCRSFMAFIPMGENFSPMEEKAIINRLIDCIKVECILRDHRFSITEAWAYYVKKKHGLLPDETNTDDCVEETAKKEKCECDPDKGPFYREDGTGQLVCNRCGLP